MKKVFLKSLAIGLLALLPVISWADVLTVNNGTAENENIPVNGYNLDAVYAHSQMIIDKTDVASLAGKDITAMQFFLKAAATKSFTNNWTITLTETTKSTVNQSYENVSAGTVVYTGTIDWRTTTPTITFDNSFTYSGDNNLLIDFHYQNSKSNWEKLAFYGVNNGFKSQENHGGSDSATANWYGFSPKITFTYETPASCKKTANISISNITDNGATISWDAVEGAEAYDVTVGTQVFTGVTGTSQVVTGLSANTEYAVSVVTDCGGGDKSSAKETSFRTDCGAYSVLTYSEDFEGYTALTAAPSAFDLPCWSALNYSSSRPAAFVSTSYVPSGNGLRFTSNSSTYVYAIMPLFEENFSAYRIKFQSKFENATQGKMYIGYLTDPTDASTWTSLKQITNSTTVSDWVVDLDAVPDGARIAFSYGGVTTSYYEAGIDNISFELLPSCKKPTALTADNETTTSVDLAWTAGASETTWNLQYRKVGSATWISVANISTNSYTLTGLNMGTDYEVQVQAACNVSELSDWTESVSFTTACSSMTLGTIYDFESDAAGSLPACWNGGNYVSSSYYDTYKENPSVVNGAIYNHTTSGSKAVKMKLYSSYVKTWVAMPKLPDGVNINDLQVSAFAYSTDGYSTTMLEVGVMNDPTNYSSFQKAGNITCESSNSGEIKVVDFSSLSAVYNTNYRYIAFRAVGYVSGTKYVYLDDIQVAPKPAAPADLAFTNIEKTTATISFTQQNPKGKWNLQVATDKDFANLVVDKAITATTENLTGLTGSTNYFVRVQHVDETYNVTSAWVSGSFATECDAKAIPYAEDFSSGVVPPCWTILSKGGNISANGALYLNSSDTAAAFLPELDYTNISGFTNAKISFWANGSTGDELKVIAASDPKSLTISDLKNQVVLGTITLTTTKTYYEIFVDDASAQLADESYIGFYTTKSYPSSFVDDLAVGEAIDRLPENLQVTDLTATKATITFDQKGYDEKGWIFEYGTDKTFATKIGDGEIEDGDPQIVALTGLTENTAYYVRIKQAQADDDAQWAVVSFTTPCGNTEFGVVYGFENMTASSMKSYTTGSSTYFSSCWTRGNKYNYNDNYMPYAYSGEKYAGNNSLCMWGTSSYAGYFAMPAFAETVDMADVIVTFYAKADNASYNTLKVGTTSGITAVNAPNFTLLGQVDLTTSWAKYEVKFEDYTGTDQLIMFYFDDGSYSYPVYIDNIEVKQVTCKNPKPSVSGITTNAAVVASGLTTGADWAWKLGETGDENQVDGANASAAISGLSSDTEYEVYVQAQCGATDGNSEWKSVTFRTACDAQVALGYEEDFAGGISTCMKAINATYNQYGTKYVSMSNKAALILPVFESTTDYSTLQLSFNASTNSTSSPELKVIAYDEAVGDLASQVVLETVSLAGTMSGVDVYLNEIAGINTIMAGKRLGFYRESAVGISLDDIVIKTASDFKAPSNLAMTADSETAEGADFTFNQGGTPTNVWVVEVATANSFASLVQSDTIDAQSFTLTGLNMKTKYYVRVKQINGAESSNYSNVVEFTTECGSFPLNTVDDLESYSGNTGTSGYATSVPNCWTAYNENNYSVYQYAFISSNSANAYSGSKSLYLTCYTQSYTKKMTWMALPEVNVADMSLLNLKFKARSSSTTSYNLEIGVMSDPTNKSTYEKIATVTPTGTYDEYTVLFNQYAGSKKYIVFMNNATYGTFYIDDIEVNESACAMADNAQVSATTDVTATLTIDNETPDWNIVVKDGNTVAFSQSNITTADVTVTGLTAQTDYVASITMNCPAGGESDPVEVAFTTACAALADADMPYFEGFESGISACMSVVTTGTYPQKCTSAAHVYEGTTSIEFYNASAANPQAVVMPRMNIDWSNYVLTFFAKLWSGSTAQTFYVALAENAPATPADVLALDVKKEYTINSATFSQFTLIFDELTDQELANKNYIVFYSVGGDILLDQVELKEFETVRTGLTVGNLYTTCQDRSMLAIKGATMYEPENFDGTYVTFVEASEVKAGYGYLFQAEDNVLKALFADETPLTTAIEDAPNGMQGTLEDIALPSGNDYCGIMNGHLQYFGENNSMTANHAYIVLPVVVANAATNTPAPATKRRLTIGPRGLVTGLDNVQFNDIDSAMKMVIDGQFFILTPEAIYNAEGNVIRKF